MPSQQTVYSRIASALTVIEFAQPIQWTFEVGTPLKSALEQMPDGPSDLVIVTENGAPKAFVETSGYLHPEEADWPIERKSKPIDIWRVISAKTSLFEIIPLWERSYYFFVLDGAEITHFVSRHHMDTAPVKAALFALTAELEEKMLRHMMLDIEKIESHFNNLNANSQKRARNLSKKKGLPNLPIAHIQNTFFSDKVEMFLASPELSGLLPFSDNSEKNEFFKFIGTLRNELAHGGWLLNVIRDASQLKEIITVTEDVISHLKLPHPNS